MKFFISILLIGLLSLSLQAQHKDSVSAYHMNPKQFIMPTAIVVGSASAFIFSDLKQSISSPQTQPIQIEDVTEWAPMASVVTLGALGVKGRHGFLDQSLLTATAFVGTAGSVYALKHTIKEERPFSDRGFAFPSGHTAFAFMGAELMRLEYGHRSPWYGIAAYTVAGSTAALRVYNGEHWVHDVLAGAGMGILCARIAYWLYPHLKKGFLLLPIANKHSVGMAIQIRM